MTFVYKPVTQIGSYKASTTGNNYFFCVNFFFRQKESWLFVQGNELKKCGGGENRTPVQSRDASRFYMFSLTFMSRPGAGGKRPLSGASPKVLIPAVRTSARTSPSVWRSILKRQANPEGTAYVKLSVSYVAVVGICVVSGKIQQVTRVLHMPQDDSHAPSKPIAPIVNELY